MIERHRLDITRPGRGVVFAMCSCGHKHTDARNGRDPSAFPAHGTVTDARIRAIHRQHKSRYSDGSGPGV